MKAPYDLDRFVRAQLNVYPGVIEELRRGRKTGHWIWYIFPQIAGLGASEASRKYSISCLGEARDYLAHPLLGQRLRDCTNLVLDIGGRTAEEIFGYPDYLKFRSCMTLFAQVDDDTRVFVAALSKYFDGETDPLTMQRIANS